MRKLFLIFSVLILIFSFTGCSEKQKERDAYAQAVSLGYSGTLDEWLAALAAENIKDKNGNISESAYKIAVEKGYTGSVKEWYQSLGIDIGKIK